MTDRGAGSESGTRSADHIFVDALELSGWMWMWIARTSCEVDVAPLPTPQFEPPLDCHRRPTCDRGSIGSNSGATRFSSTGPFRHPAVDPSLSSTRSCGRMVEKPSSFGGERTMRALRWSVSRLALLFYAREWNRLQQRLHDARIVLDSVTVSQRPPRILKSKVVAGEDHRYYRHCGVDLVAICRAMWRTLACGRREGASTIEMQLVRVLTGQYQRTFGRKRKEVFLAVLLSGSASKADLAALYVFLAYYGTGMDGFLRATRRLDIRPDLMDARQAASLAARLKYPEPRSLSEGRRRQIGIRTEYLLSRYAKYFDRPATVTSARQASHATL